MKGYDITIRKYPNKVKVTVEVLDDLFNILDHHSYSFDPGDRSLKTRIMDFIDDHTKIGIEEK